MEITGKRHRSIAACRRGAALLEFAIVAPVLLLLSIGIVEFCLVMFVQSLLQDAVNQGARLHKIGLPDSAIVQKIDDVTAALLDPARISFSARSLPGNVTLYTVSYPWNVNTPLISLITGDPVILTATGVSG